ncbi:MAG: TonB-dependent receptor [Bryobacterales bacterium]|nr:TonB-dependent receptor [Bryobacterales bacterium]
MHFRFWAVGLSALFAAPVFAQLALSSLRGTVTDSTGGVVAGAQVSVLNVNTNATRSATTNNNGDYEFPDLVRGDYKVTITATGFKQFVADLVLDTNQIRRINATLEIGQVGTQVTVEAGAAVIQTDSARIQGSISGQKYGDVPWVGAEATLDPSLILTTMPLVNQTSGVWSSQWAGQNTRQVQEGQDGHTNDGAVNQLNDILDVEEVTVVTVNNTAEYSRVGYMNMVTKQGTNQFHGRLMYWHQNSALGTREFFEPRKAKQLIHTTSLSLSGPIVKNKTFFYASGNILKVPSKQYYLTTVPTERMRNGDFSQLLAGSNPVIINDPTTGRPFPGNIIPTNRISSIAQKVNGKYLPAPNRGGPDQLSNNYEFFFPFPTDYSLRQDFTQRVDHNFSDKNRLMGRMIENRDLYVLPSSYPTFSWTRKRWNLHFVVEDTYIISPSLVNTVRVGMYQEKVTDGDTLYNVTPFKGDEAVKELGLQGVNSRNLSAMGFPRMDITGYPTLQQRFGGVVQDDRNWGIADSLTWSRGKHVIKMGGEYKPQSRFNGSVPEGTYGVFNFNGRFSNYGYSDFLLGIPFASTRLDPLVDRTLTDSEFGVYITDSFKATSRLTLDLGIRWDRFGSPAYKDGLMLNWDPTANQVIIPADTQGKVSALYPKNIPIVTGDVRMKPDKGNFAPRFGAAYRVTDKWVLRGGYGIYTETLGRYQRVQGGGPFQISETYNNVVENGVPLFQMPNPFPASLANANIPSQTVTGYPMQVDNGRIHQFNLTVERQLKNIGVRVSYVGSRNKGMNYAIGINKPQPSLIPFTAARRPYPQFTGATYYRNDGQQKFNAMTVELNKRVGSLTFNGHWSLASNYDNTQNLENPYAPLFWERDGFTPRQRVVVNAVWEVPVGKGRKLLANAPRPVDYALGGWQLYWIGYFETGQFFGPTFGGADPSNTNTVGGRPDRICDGNLPPEQRTVTRWFDPKCFVAPPAGRFGNSGTNVLEGPGYNMQHLSLAKSFAITERWKFTLTAAATNLGNHPNFAKPAANISAPANVGVISNLRDGGRARRIEIRGRIDF